MTYWWECGVFAFILAISEVNIYFDSSLLFLLWVMSVGNSYATGFSLEVGVATY